MRKSKRTKELEKLIQRVEHEEPNVNLQTEIAKFFGWKPIIVLNETRWLEPGNKIAKKSLPDWFYSLDLARSLIPPGWFHARTFRKYPFSIITVVIHPIDYSEMPQYGYSMREEQAIISSALKTKLIHEGKK